MPVCRHTKVETIGVCKLNASFYKMMIKTMLNTCVVSLMCTMIVALMNKPMLFVCEHKWTGTVVNSELCEFMHEFAYF